LPAGDNRCFKTQIVGIPTDADVEENLINVLSEVFLICGHYEKIMSKSGSPKCAISANEK
jgi:hypothetical protein